MAVADEGGCGVYVTRAADVRPADLVAGLCGILERVTRAALERPGAERAGELGLGEDVF